MWPVPMDLPAETILPPPQINVESSIFRGEPGTWSA